jgi:hypothetical protein
MVNLPSLSVLADTCLPLSTTVAPGSASPSPERTVPVTAVCAHNVVCRHNSPAVRKIAASFSRALKKTVLSKEKKGS